MKEYELLYIVGTQFTDQEIADIQSKMDDLLVQMGAKVLKTQNLGKIKLAYPIKKTRHGSYILSYFDGEPLIISDLNRRLGLAEEVLRHTLLTRPAGSLERTFELSSYVAPLSDEAKQERDMKRSQTKQAPRKVEAQLPSPPPASATEPAMTMEELDQKLDKILEGDIAENI